MTQGSILKAALLGGILAGVVSSIPILNMACCLWVTGGGAFAAWTLVSDGRGRASLARCALGGFFAGVLAGLICAPLSGLVNRLVHGADFIEAQVEQALALMGSSGGLLPPEEMERIARGASFLEFNLGSVAALMMMAFLFSFLGLLGGIVGGAIFGRNAAAGEAWPPAFPPSMPLAPKAQEAPETEQGWGELAPDELPSLPRRDDESNS